MKRIFMFDVDGTLTPARRRMTSEFLKFFLEFCRKNKAYLVSGSDYNKLLEQVPAEVLKLECSLAPVINTGKAHL